MKEMKIGGKTFQYEKVMPEQFEKGACAFRVKDPDGDENWWVVIPPTLKAQLEDVAIDSPDDGRIAAFCMSEQDALVIASSVGIAANVVSIAPCIKEEVGRKAKELADKLDFDLLADKLDFDLDALEAEVKRLKDEGKSPKEVAEILKPRMEEFKKKPDADKKGGEW